MMDKKEYKIKRRTTRSKTICIDIKDINIDADRQVRANEDHLVRKSTNLDLLGGEAIIKNKIEKQEEKKEEKQKEKQKVKQKEKQEEKSKEELENKIEIQIKVKENQKRVTSNNPLLTNIHKYKQVIHKYEQILMNKNLKDVNHIIPSYFIVNENTNSCFKKEKVSFSDPVITSLHKYKQIIFDDTKDVKNVRKVIFTDPVITSVHKYKQVVYNINKDIKPVEKKVSFSVPVITSVHNYKQVEFKENEEIKPVGKKVSFSDPVITSVHKYKQICFDDTKDENNLRKETNDLVLDSLPILLPKIITKKSVEKDDKNMVNLVEENHDLNNMILSVKPPNFKEKINIKDRIEYYENIFIKKL